MVCLCWSKPEVPQHTARTPGEAFWGGVCSSWSWVVQVLQVRPCWLSVAEPLFWVGSSRKSVAQQLSYGCNDSGCHWEDPGAVGRTESNATTRSMQSAKTKRERGL